MLKTTASTVLLAAKPEPAMFTQLATKGFVLLISNDDVPGAVEELIVEL